MSGSTGLFYYGTGKHFLLQREYRVTLTEEMGFSPSGPRVYPKGSSFLIESRKPDGRYSVVFEKDQSDFPDRHLSYTVSQATIDNWLTKESKPSIEDPAEYISKKLVYAILEAQRKQRMTNNELSERTGVSLYLIKEMSDLKKTPSLKTLGRLAKTLSLNVTIQIEEIDDPYYEPLYIGKEYKLAKDSVFMVNGATLVSCRQGERVRVVRFYGPDVVEFIFTDGKRMQRDGTPSFFRVEQEEIEQLFLPASSKNPKQPDN